MAIMPAAFVTAQDKGISTVKDGQTAVGQHIQHGHSQARQHPALSKRELRRQRVARRNLHYNILGGPRLHPRLRPADWRKCFDDFSYEPERHHPATLRGTCSHRTDVQRRTQFVLQAATIL